MHEPEFEKKVQQKMEELEFSPSEAVWMNLERRIGTKKRRRLPLFWLFFLPGLLLGAAGAYIILAPSAHTQITSAHSSSQAAETPVPSASAGLSSGNAAPGADPASSAATSPATPGHGAPADAPASPSTPARNPATASDPALHQPLVPAGSSTLRNPGTVLRSGPDPITGPAAGRTVLTHRNSFDHTAKRPSSPTQAAPFPMTPSGMTPIPSGTATTIAGPLLSSAGSAEENSLHRSPTGKIIPLGAGMNTDPASRGATNKPVYPKWAKDRFAASAGATNKAKPYKASRWSAGFAGGGGLSSIHQPSSGKALAYYAPSTQYVSLAAVNRAAAAPNYVADPIRPDFSFWAGIFAQSPIANRISFSVGLNLHYYSAIISTGKQVVNSPNASPVASSLFYGSALAPTPTLSYPYYPTGTDARFTNRYYFLELPLALQWQLNRSRKIPLFWEGGLSVSRLMAADALYYDGKMGVYYKDKGNNGQTELNISTALMVGLNGGAAGRMQLGPQLQYGLTSLNSGISGQHLWYGGIKFTLVLGPGRSRP